MAKMKNDKLFDILWAGLWLLLGAMIVCLSIVIKEGRQSKTEALLESNQRNADKILRQGQEISDQLRSLAK